MTTPLKGLPPQMLLYLLLQLVFLLGTAHLLGELARRWKQPAVLGNILAGVLLGPSVLGHWFPALQLAIFPHDQNQGNLLAAVTWIGLILLLLSTGLETDLDLIVRKWRVSVSASAGGIIVPFISGFLLGHFIPETFLAHPNDRLAFSLFLAVAMCISSLPVIASIMREIKAIPLSIRQIALAAGMMDDTVGWTLLAIVSGLFLSGPPAVAERRLMPPEPNMERALHALTARSRRLSAGSGSRPGFSGCTRRRGSLP